SPIAVRALRFDIHLPLAAEPVEVVDERSAHERLNRSIDVFDVHSLLQRLVALDRDELLRHVGQECRRKRREFRTLARGGNELVRVVGEKRDVTSGAILEDERKAAGRSDTGDGRRRERERDALPESGEFLVHVLTNGLVLFFSRLPILPLLQR